jgi:hypothetical protein
MYALLSCYKAKAEPGHVCQAAPCCVQLACIMLYLALLRGTRALRDFCPLLLPWGSGLQHSQCMVNIHQKA